MFKENIEPIEDASNIIVLFGDIILKSIMSFSEFASSFKNAPLIKQGVWDIIS